MHPELDADLGATLGSVPATVSYWFGGLGGIGDGISAPYAAQNANAVHYAASTMKVAVMAAAYRLGDEDELDLDKPVAVHNDFRSASGKGSFSNDPGYDNDPEPWQLLGQTASLRWLVRRMIIMSSNLATNLVLEHVGFDAVQDAWSSSGAVSSKTLRGIEDYAANEAGKSNVVTAADLAGLLCAIRGNALSTTESSGEMIDVMRAQEANEPLDAGLPEDVPVASKSGWVDGVRHSMAIVSPADAPEFVLTTCVSADQNATAADSEPTDDALADVVTRITKAAWQARQKLEGDHT
jgi:beta-lactamase class A